MKNRKNFSFDVGMKSLGVAVNENGEIIHSDVLLMHLDAGSVKAQAERRRMFRTREAHKTREAVLESLWRTVGKEPLQRKRFRKVKPGKSKATFVKTKADERLEREFPAKGDPTVYASSLLRIMLLEGQQLEDWQIYKALHASIQRRGYDKNVPWKAREEDKTKENKLATGKDENPENQVGEFNKKLQKMTPDEHYHLPCYYDAWKMGLWDNQTKKIINIRQPFKPERARGYNPSRELVTREIEQLLHKATKIIPALADYLTDDKRQQLLYGEQHNAIDKRYPSATKIDGLLGQKYPRFENRIVSECALISRLNVCNSGKRLAIEVGFLLRLVNWRYEQENEHGEKSEHMLTSQQIKDKFHECESAWKKKSQEYKSEEYAKYFKLTPSKVAKMAERSDDVVKAGHEEIPASKHTGRSRFSQPALYLMKSLILSEKTPKEFYEELSQRVATQEKENPGAEFGYQIFSDVPYKYRADDFKFLEKMGNGRDAIHVPDMSLAEHYMNEDGDVEPAIQKVINSCNWPELRHRLNVFRRELENLVEKYGTPDAVHLEFIREDFLGKKKKNEYIRQSKEGRDNHKKAIKKLKKLKQPVTDKNILRYRLYKEQNKQCLYTKDAIDISKLESYDIDHIFPQKDGGPDAYYNKVLTSQEVNRQKKGKRLPCECDFINWAAFKTRLKNLNLGKNKKKLLLVSTREEAESLVEKYTGLAGTAYIARLARDIVCLQFDWQPGEKSEQQRVFVFSGGQTSKFSKKYKLYKVLGDGNKEYQKDRTDHRHHALDAMVISYLRQWTRDKSKADFFKFPEGIDASYFAEKLKDVNPHYITKMRPALREQQGRKRKGHTGTKKSSSTGKTIHYVNKKHYKNISKDPDERGQWYTNETERPEESGKTGGTSQHGYLFYKDDKGKVCHKTIHSFRSPHAMRKEVEKKASQILGLFYQGKRIYLSENRTTATQLGRNARLKFGEYEVIKKRRGDVTIRDSEQQQDSSNGNDSTSRYRIRLAALEKIRIYNELVHGKSFDLNNFYVNKDKNLTGNYKMDNSNTDLRNRNLMMANTQTATKEDISFASLVKYLAENNWLNDIKVKDIVTINMKHLSYISKVKADDLPDQNIPEGYYLIKGFTGNRVYLTSQNGTVYRMGSKILAYAEKTDERN